MTKIVSEVVGTIVIFSNIIIENYDKRQENESSTFFLQ